MGNAQVKGAAANRLACVEGNIIAEIVPEAQREAGSFSPLRHIGGKPTSS